MSLKNFVISRLFVSHLLSTYVINFLKLRRVFPLLAVTVVVVAADVVAVTVVVTVVVTIIVAVVAPVAVFVRIRNIYYLVSEKVSQSCSGLFSKL